MKQTRWIRTRVFLPAITALLALPLSGADSPPDLTLGNKRSEVDRSRTYNLGSTGLRGWIEYRAGVGSLEFNQGRTTALSRQILVTHVGTHSPASGVMHVDDVILGVDGKEFTDDARKSIAKAITEAEKASNAGLLKLLRWLRFKAAAALFRMGPAAKPAQTEIKYHFKEAIPAAVTYAQTQGGHGSQDRTEVIMKELIGYGTAARPTIPGLKALIEQFNNESKTEGFPDWANKLRIASVEKAIKEIEAAKDQPAMRTIGPTQAAGTSQ